MFAACLNENINGHNRIIYAMSLLSNHDTCVSNMQDSNICIFFATYDVHTCKGYAYINVCIDEAKM